MKICMMCPHDLALGGWGVWLREMSKRLEKRGHEIVYPNEKNFDSPKQQRLWFWFKCKPPKADIVQSIDFNLPSLSGKTSTVSTYLGTWQGNFLKSKKPSAFVAAIMERIRAELSDVNIAISRYTQRWVKNSIYIHNGCDIKKFNPSIRGFKIDTKKIKVLWVGRKEYIKGYYDLPKVTNPFHLIKCMNVPFYDMPKYYATADVVILPSHMEGMPYAVLEANACGKPVVAFDVGGMADCVFHGVNGYLVKENDYKDFIEKVKLAFENRKRLGRNGRKLCELIFNWDNVVIRYEEIYERILRRCK